MVSSFPDISPKEVKILLEKPISHLFVHENKQMEIDILDLYEVRFPIHQDCLSHDKSIFCGTETR